MVHLSQCIYVTGIWPRVQPSKLYGLKESSALCDISLSPVPIFSRYPLSCEAESRGDFTDNPPEWEVDMTTRRNDQAAPAVPLK